jgi:putative glutamine amidotransferase
MILLAVSQRVDLVPGRAEKRDALDQRWAHFLAHCGFAPILMPNHPETAAGLFVSTGCAGVLLTGGNDLQGLGGDAPERDRTEHLLIDKALEKHIPVLGVCRGMQLIQQRYGTTLKQVEGHVAAEHVIDRSGSSLVRTCYHRYAATKTVSALEILARTNDGVIEEVRHVALPMRGLMWHPERQEQPATADIELFRSFFNCKR